MRPLIVYGAGGHAREVARIIREINAVAPAWEVRAFVSDDPAPHEIDGLPVLGAADGLRLADRCSVVIAVGDGQARRRIHETLSGTKAQFPNIVHPSVSIDASISLGVGTTIAAGSILTVDISIGDFVLINRACNVSHDCTIGDFSSLAPGTLLSGNVTVGALCEIGTGAAVIPGVTIYDGAVIGAGAAVITDIPAHCTAVGVPARVIRSRGMIQAVR